MKLLIFVIGLFLAHVVVQGNSDEFDERVRDCIEINDINPESISSFIVNGTVEKKNKDAANYFGCVLNFTEYNELIVNEYCISFVTTVFASHFQTEPILARELAEESIQICKPIIGTTREETAVQIMHCLMIQVTKLKNKKL
ncbi:hypothetical protein ILUMI_12196 [Ignelater luminosus]|uniref:Uncharacterized protein n=1 Tax=Ignelater luminosus TaxID=2038154 RepID=A0A8K0CUS4_IGNLU|nr:hypothetical protein ILUMI_12196 [Ignelater luminosus]